MEIHTHAGELLDLLSVVKPAVNPRSSVAIQASIALSASGNGVVAAASNGEIAIKAYAAVTVDSGGDVVITPDPIMRYLGSHPPKTPIHVRSSNGTLQIAVQGAAPYRFRVLDIASPPIPDVDGPPFTVPWRLLNDRFVAVHSAVDPESGLVLIARDSERISMTSTDSYRLASVSVPMPAGTPFRALVPASTIQTALGIKPTSIALDIRRRSVRFAAPHVQITARTAVYPFPNVSSVLSECPDPIIDIDNNLLKPALSRLGSVVSSEPITVQVSDGELTLAVASRGIGSGRETIPVHTVTDAQLLLKVAYRYLVDALAGHSNQVHLSWTGALQPIFLTSGDDDGSWLTTVVMPVRDGAD